MSEQAKYYLRIEAVNFDNTILDTNDLSTIRGGGLRALECASSIPELSQHEQIYVGASQGLYAIKNELNDADSFRHSILTSINDTYPELTVTVELLSCAKASSFPDAVKRLAAQSAWSQMQSPSVVYPGEGKDVCHFDRVRPAAESEPEKGYGEIAEKDRKRVPISKHSLDRREHGIGQKHQDFYKYRIQHDAPFVSDFDYLTQYTEAGKLQHKMAVIYLDGNGFGSFFKACENKDQYSTLSRQLQTSNTKFLNKKLLQIDTGINNGNRPFQQTPWHWSGWVVTNEQNKVKKCSAIRLETLLWGGDEIIWVVPAWQGWQWMQEFFQHWGKEGNWDNTHADPQFKGNQLRWGGSIVFCHHDAPIHDITALAKALADKPKEEKTINRFAYQVLESFDSLGADPFHIRNRKLPLCLRSSEGDSEYMVLPGNCMADIANSIRTLKKTIPRSRVHDIVFHLCHSRVTEVDVKPYYTLLDKYGRSADFQTLTKYIFGDCTDNTHFVATWIHLNELWDYIPETAQESKA